MADGQGSDMTIMAIAGHVSRRMLEHYSYIRIDAKRRALDALAAPAPPVVFETGVHQNRIQFQAVESGQVTKSLN